MSPVEAFALAVLLALFVALAIIDLRHQILPNVLVYPGAAAALAAAPLLPADGYVTSLIGGVGGFALFAALYFARPGVIGGGDVKLAALIGFAIGFPEVIVALALAPLLVLVVAIPMLVGRRWSLQTRFPYGPYLCAGAGTMALLASL